jgi:UDP-glucose 6-dehydrogenase
MKVKFIAAKSMKGISKNTGRPYDMTTLTYAVPLEPRVSEKFTLLGSGFDTRDLPLDPRVLDQFRGYALGDDIDVIIEPDPSYPTRTIVVGLA